MTDKYKDLRDALIPILEPEWLDQGNGVKIRHAADVNDWLKSKNPFDELTETIRALLAERDALRRFANQFVEAWDDGMAGDSSIYLAAKAALAQEQGEKHGDQDN